MVTNVRYGTFHTMGCIILVSQTRVVFDCSAPYEGVSLNQQLLQGPDLMNNLTGILLIFREHSIAIVGDNEALFHQVKVQRSDQERLSQVLLVV